MSCTRRPVTFTVQYIDEIIDVPIVVQRQVPIAQTVRKTEEGSLVRLLDRVLDVPVVMQRQAHCATMPQERILERIVEETDVPVSRVTERITEVVKHMPREHVQGNTVEQSVDVTDPLIQEETVEVIPPTRQNQTPGRVHDEIVEKKDDYKKSFEQFYKRLKLGIHKSFVDRAEISELLRFNTSKSGDEQTNLKGDIGRMKEGQHHGREYRCRILFVILGKFAQERS